ncbi:tetratricopeptide repeat protein, partial [Candidatus Poribacteria bacterium]|nr:tetratricopeptide repeat protein [Candidatus Poribacteria bacterium]
WDKMIISSGASVYAPKYADIKDKERELAMSGIGEELLYYKEGIETTVAVKQRPETGTVVMTVNGKVDASNSGDMYTQLMVGHIPLLVSKNPETAMVIGLGSGVTLGAAAQHPSLKNIDCVELSSAVVEASEFFRDENRNVLDDKRVNLLVNDGRNHLATTQKKYVVIISEPSNLWLAGMANLFSQEFYELCKKRLADDGVIIQWVHIYHMSQENLKVVVKTFNSIFPHTTIWYTLLGDLLMLGTHEELEIDYLELAKRYNIPGVLEDMQRLSIREPLAILSCYLLDEDGVAKMVSGAEINTDDHPILEYSTPRSLYMNTANANHRMLMTFRNDMFPKMVNFNRERVTGRASFWYHMGAAYDFKGVWSEAEKSYKKAISVSPDFAPAYVGLALLQHRDEKTSLAIENLKKAIQLDPAEANTYYNLAQMYEETEKMDKAVENYRLAIKYSPRPERYHEKLGDLFMEYDEHENAVMEYENIKRKDAMLLYKIGLAYKASGKIKKALQSFENAVKANQNLASVYQELGNLYRQDNQNTKALEAYKKLVELKPYSRKAHLSLADMYEATGNKKEAEKERRLAVDLID